MKRFFTLLAAMFVLTTTFTSCWSEDDEIRSTLRGTWQGNMHIYMTFNGYDGDYYASNSTITFNSDGTGYQVDHFGYNAPRSYVFSEFRWSVTAGVIHLKYIEDNYYVNIYDYNLTDNYFDGRFEDGTTFRLNYLSSYDWNYYRNGYSKATRTSSDNLPAFTRHMGK